MSKDGYSTRTVVLCLNRCLAELRALSGAELEESRVNYGSANRKDCDCVEVKQHEPDSKKVEILDEQALAIREVSFCSDHYGSDASCMSRG